MWHRPGIGANDSKEVRGGGEPEVIEDCNGNWGCVKSKTLSSRKKSRQRSLDGRRRGKKSQFPTTIGRRRRKRPLGGALPSMELKNLAKRPTRRQEDNSSK